MALGCDEPVPADRAEDVIPVRVETVQPSLISEEARASARLEGSEEALVYPAIPGRIEEVLVEEGDSVRVGQTLVSLATDRQVRAGLSSARAAIAAASADLENQERTLERTQSLYEAGAVSEQQLDGARTAYEAARARLEQAYAAAQQAGSNQANATIDAPFDGRIGRIWAREGSLAGNGPLLSIANAGALEAEVLLPERYLPDLSIGLPAYISVTAYDGESYPGMVTATARSVDPLSGLVPVEVTFANESGDLMPGMTGMVSVAVRTVDSALTVPEIALRRTESGFGLATVREGRITVSEVATGISNRGRVHIESGLRPGDLVVVEGQFRVSDGDSVRIVE
ncbi:efflux RND transporter periplasmic adaptor subunit [Candidatus Fermentibacteria bacterium]|nr:efflux RND transporter periplasmic adaptor subunit [Candidatus Fermentibacteria bacterium]